MGLFWVNYQNAPGQCIYAQGGLKFRADEEALCRYFAPILPHVSLNDLIGEAVFWVLLPSTLAIWIFPFLLYSQEILFAIIIGLVLYLILEIGHMTLYLKPLNYLVFILANPLPQFVVYIVWAVILIRSGSVKEAIVLAAWFLSFRFGLESLISSILLIPFYKIYFSLPPSDTVLRNIGWHYAKKFGIDTSKWKMYDRETGNGV